jgi:hypothetical protein
MANIGNYDMSAILADTTNYERIKKKSCYKNISGEDDTLFILQIFYIGIACFWILLVSYFKLWREKFSFILFIPLIAFFISFLYLEDVSPAVEENMSKTNFLSVGIILTFPILSWMVKEHNGDKKHFITLAIVALVLSLVTFIDIWVPENRLSIYRHIKSSFQVMSVCLFIYALIVYYFYAINSI